MKRFVQICSVMLVWLMAAGCVNADSVDGPVDMPLTDILTFDGNMPDATFLYWAPGSEQPERLVAAGVTIDTAAVAPGQRVFAVYVPQSDASASITLRSCYPITSKRLTGTPGVPRGWNSDSVWLTSAWRSGQYVDMRLRLPYSTEPRAFALAVDSSTIDSGRPELYLVHRLPEDVSADSTFRRTYYASFDISSLWSRSDIEEVTVNVANTNIPSLRSFTFTKP